MSTMENAYDKRLIDNLKADKLAAEWQIVEIIRSLSGKYPGVELSLSLIKPESLQPGIYIIKIGMFIP